MKICNRTAGKVIYEDDAETIKKSLENAVSSGANLSGADLSGANLSDANLSDANLSDANLSGADGLLLAAEWLNDNYEKSKDGYIVYKTFGLYHHQPKEWIIKPDHYITEVVNPCRTVCCACGVNFATLEWININDTRADKEVWRCLLEWQDLADLVVPYNTDGKARCGRLKLIGKEQIKNSTRP